MDSDNIFEGLKENKKTLIIVLILFVVMIGISVLNLFLGNNDGNINMKEVVQSFAQIYYEEYYYPGLKENYPNNYYNALADIEKDGIKLTLDMIIDIFEDVNTSRFYEEGNYCDFSQTYATIYPTSPYDIDDYKIDVNVSCEKELNY